MDRRINLLPPELLARRKARQAWVTIAAAGLGLVVLLGAIYGLQTARLASERSELEVQEEVNADLTRQAASLAQFERVQQELANRQRLLQQLTAAEVRWSALLADVSLVIPSNVWLTTLNGSVRDAAEETPATPGTPAAAGPTAIGEIQMGGVTFEHIDVARWLTRLAGVDAFLLPYISISQRTSLDDVDVVTFNSSVDLTDESLRRNQRGGERRP